MSIRFLSHASASISAGETTVVTDPWLSGSCFWNGWDLDPPSIQDPADLSCDAITLSHWHEDHFHKPSFRLIDKSIPVFIPRFPISWMYTELLELGFKTVIEVDHGQTVKISSDLSVTFFQVQYQDDAVMYESGDDVIVNLNDSKSFRMQRESGRGTKKQAKYPGDDVATATRGLSRRALILSPSKTTRSPRLISPTTLRRLFMTPSGSHRTS